MIISIYAIRVEHDLSYPYHLKTITISVLPMKFITFPTVNILGKPLYLCLSDFKESVNP